MSTKKNAPPRDDAGGQKNVQGGTPDCQPDSTTSEGARPATHGQHLLTANELADELGVTVAAVRRWVNAGLIPVTDPEDDDDPEDGLFDVDDVFNSLLGARAEGDEELKRASMVAFDDALERHQDRQLRWHLGDDGEGGSA